MDNFYDDISTSPYVVCVQWSLHATSCFNIYQNSLPHKVKQFEISSNYQLRKEQATSSQLNIPTYPSFPQSWKNFILVRNPILQLPVKMRGGVPSPFTAKLTRSFLPAQGGSMRFKIHYQHLCPKIFGASEPAAFVRLSGNPCTAMVSMRRDLQILRLRRKIWRAWKGGSRFWWFFFSGGIFWRWESDRKKDSTWSKSV